MAYFPPQPNESPDYYVVKDPTSGLSGPRTNLAIAAQRIWVETHDTRPGAYDSGEYGFYEQHSGRGGFTSQATVDRHNDYVYKNNNGDFPDRLHGQSAVRERQPAAKTKKRKHWFWPW